MRKFSLLLILSISSVLVHAQADQELIEEFISYYARMNDTPKSEVRQIMEEAKFQQEIIDKMTRPAEKTMTWERYRNIFIKQERIDAGVAFWNQYEAEIKAVEERSGVDAQVIMGIIGVETFYGKIKGSYRVLDALYTLAFGYPKRSTYFRKELEEFLNLAKKEKLDVLTIQGSYAGAMGYCQFMPSSYRAYAKSYDEGGTRDLVGSPEDAIASVANYLAEHKYKKGGLIAIKANEGIDPIALEKQPLKPAQTISYYKNRGYIPAREVNPDTPATLLQLELESGKEYWFGFDNFYSITRYNHSELYALAVFQLGEAVKKAKGN